MIQGIVNTRHEAVVRLPVRGPDGIVLDVDLIVDTGFTSSLTLPLAMISTLGLGRQTSGNAVLADGTVRKFDIWAAEVYWNGSWRAILVSAIGDEPLMGMHLLAGHRIVIDVVPNGFVEITSLS